MVARYRSAHGFGRGERHCKSGAHGLGHPLRFRILGELGEAESAAELARRKRRCIERLVRAVARS